MKRFLSLLLAMMILFALPGCGGNKGSAEDAGMNWQEQYDLGIRYLSEGNYEEAIIAFTAAIQIDPKAKDAYLGMAEAYVSMDDIDQAIETLFRALDEIGEDPELIALLEEMGVVFGDAPQGPGTFRVELGDGYYAMITEDEMGRQTRQEIYAPTDELERYWIYEYNEQGNESRSTEYAPDGAVTLVAENRTDGTMERVTEYDPDGSYVVSLFNEQEARERFEYYAPDGSLGYYIVTEYDASGNPISNISYYGDGSVMSEEGIVSFLG